MIHTSSVGAAASAAQACDAASLGAQAPDAGVESSRIKRLKDVLLTGVRDRQLPLHEVVMASMEFFVTGREQGFVEAAERARRASGAKPHASMRSYPELTKDLLDRGLEIQYLPRINEDLLALNPTFGGGWPQLPRHAKQLVPVPNDLESCRAHEQFKSWARPLIDALKPGQAMVLIPPSRDMQMMIGRREGGDRVVVGARPAMAPGALPSVHEGADAERLLDQALTMPGGSMWALVVQPERS